jgi:DNA-binding NarL/FixJ family response regulator
MDIRLHGENGLKLSRKIKKLCPEIVIGIFTTFDLPEYREAAFENGADFYLNKSSSGNISRLYRIVDSILSGSNSIRY